MSRVTSARQMIQPLIKRKEWLRRRIAEARNDLSYDRQELSSLNWILSKINILDEPVEILPIKDQVVSAITDVLYHHNKGSTWISNQPLGDWIYSALVERGFLKGSSIMEKDVEVSHLTTFTTLGPDRSNGGSDGSTSENCEEQSRVRESSSGSRSGSIGGEGRRCSSDSQEHEESREVADHQGLRIGGLDASS
jgi:hypothetical protein